MGWLSGWLYRKSITLSRASGAVTNYQMKLLVGESSGASGEDVDCGGLCQSDFDDLRFTTADGETLLDYWIESKSGVTPNQLATVWIEFDSIGTGATTFYMYYGNASAAAVSSGSNTFIKFDGFEYGSNGDTLISPTVQAESPATISTDHSYEGSRCCKLAGESGSNASCSLGQTGADCTYQIRFRVWKEDAASITLIAHGHSDWKVDVRVNTSEVVTCYPSGTSVGTLPKDQWVEIVVQYISFTSHTYDLYVGGSLFKSAAAMSNESWANDIIITSNLASGVGNDVYIDNYIVRNWRPTEPAWGSWGAQEYAPKFYHHQLRMAA